MTTPSDQQYLLSMAENSVRGNSTESDAYGVITEAFILHKNPRDRYTIFPQLYLPWKPHRPTDTRRSLPDFALGRYYASAPHIRLLGGCEVKRATALMENLPPPWVVREDEDVVLNVHNGRFQAEDQAKSAVKGGLLPNDQSLLWLLRIGPYFTILKFGPFSDAQLATRGHRVNDSGDFWVSLDIAVKKEGPAPPFELYLLGTPAAAAALEQFITAGSALLSAD